MTSPLKPAPRRPGLFSRLRASFLTGIVVIAPVSLTIWLIWTLMGWVDGFVLPLVPGRFNPEQYTGINLRGPRNTPAFRPLVTWTSLSPPSPLVRMATASTMVR